ncbi:MAG TPA: EutN/CcmL family microcompartment protein, partial [Clostridia bacterium]|nr:EutN/CcmL family microcompartment protein [Clostridia bacterium]
MYICLVHGKCVSTIKNKKLAGYSLVTVQKLKKNGKLADEIMVAVDTIGCSVGETVLVTEGENAKHALE